MEDFGLKVLESDVTGEQEVLSVPSARELSSLTPTPDARPFSHLVDAESGKKLVDMTWPEIKGKALKDNLFKKGMKKADILAEYEAMSTAPEALPE